MKKSKQPWGVTGVMGIVAFALILSGGIMFPSGAAADGDSAMQGSQETQDTQETQLPGTEQQDQGAFSDEATGDVQQTEIPGATEPGAEGMEGGSMGNGMEGGEQPSEGY